MMKWLYSCLQRYMNAWLLKAFVINIMMIIIMTVIRGCVMALSVSMRCSYPCWNRTTETPNGKRMHISEIDISVHINNSQREFNNNSTAAANGQARQLTLSETVVVATYTHTHSTHITSHMWENTLDVSHNNCRQAYSSCCDFIEFNYQWHDL